MPDDTRIAEWRVLVTGATGPLGRRLVAYLAPRVAVLRLLVRDPDQSDFPGAQCVRGDLRDSASLVGLGEGVDTLFHLASYHPKASDPDPENHSGHWEVTAEGTRILLDALSTAPLQRVVFSGTVRSFVVGPGATHYGAAKRRAEELIFAQARQNGWHASSIRLPALYGEPGVGAVAMMAEAIRRRRFPPVPEFGNRRSLLHLEDAVSALILAATAAGTNGRALVATDGIPYSTRGLYEMISRATGVSVPGWTLPLWVLWLLALAGDVGGGLLGRPLPFNRGVLEKLRDSCWFDDGTFREVAGYRPVHTVESALRKLAE